MLNFTKKLEKFILYWSLTAGFILLLTVFLTVTNILGFILNFIARYFGRSFPALAGYEDAVSLLVGVSVLAMFPCCQLLKGHLAVDIFIEKAPLKIQKLIASFSDFLFFILSLFFTIMMFYGMLDSFYDEAITYVLGWKIWPFYLVSIFSCALWSVVALLSSFRLLEWKLKK